MQKLSLVDETFDLNLTFEYSLSIQISLDGFSFSILDNLQNKVVYLCYHELYDSKPEFVLKRLQNIYEESELLQLAYKRTAILLSNSTKQQLISSELFIPEEVTHYQQVAFSKIKNHHSEYFNMKSCSMKLVLSSPELIRSWLSSKHPSAVFTPNLINWEKQIDQKKNMALVSISKRKIFLVIYGDHGLSSFNSYPWYDESDLLYFILGSLKNQPAQIEQLLLSGMVNRFSYIYHQLKSYVEKVDIVERPSEIHYSYLLEKLPDARFVDLFHLFS